MINRDRLVDEINRLYEVDRAVQARSVVPAGIDKDRKHCNCAGWLANMLNQSTPYVSEFKFCPWDGRRLRLKPYICKQCGANYIPRQKNQKFCCVICHDNWHNKRR